MIAENGNFLPFLVESEVWFSFVVDCMHDMRRWVSRCISKMLGFLWF